MRKARKRMLRQNEKEREDYKPALEKTKLLRLLTTLPLYPLQMKSDH